ncbi:DUF5829 family protein [Actinocatenispora rupis]|uniref:Uncharacterized protein n=1 Tax=Actinocatenispora rupis TaxID=519421 RepID=A0A8J3N9P9_9ACTN|nr:DUF5829 family protein [Actinocatenispora rupis]GID11539.1 hypothetical protein Aru02nite_24280 [Actinocatenispora rupis]
MTIPRVMVRKLMVAALVLAVALGMAFAGAARPAHAGAAHQLLFFNHAYGVFDRETADAIEHSEYLKDFANFQVRTTTGAGGEKWTGRYLLGRETYLELFGVGDVPGQDGTLGAAGTGLSVERAGDLATVTQRLRDEGVADPVTFRQTRDFGDGKPVPWFDAVFTDSAYDAYNAWGMEYLPEYFADPRSNTKPARYPGDVGRLRYMPDGYQDHLMRDVTEVSIDVTSGDLGDTVPLLRAGGFVVRSTQSGAVAVRGGTTLRFTTRPRDHVGVRHVEMSLNHPVGYRHVEQLGHSTLVVGPGLHAEWSFPLV